MIRTIVCQLEKQVSRLDHRIGLAAPLRVPDETARLLGVERMGSA